jgi:RHS repeat-associated protein
MKKIYFLFLLTLLPLVASAHDAEIDGIYYCLEDSKEATVIQKTYSGDIIIPEYVTFEDVNYHVTSIGDYAFYNCSDLLSVVIPGSVTSIGVWAFNGCSSLMSVIIPKSVTTIGSCSFQGCSSMSNIMVESGNPIYDSRDNCNAIIETNSNTLIAGCMNTMIPNSVTTIGNSAFIDCSGLTSIVIPSSVKTIETRAFWGCSGLTSLTIPSSVTSICSDLLGSSFQGCIGLTSIKVDNGNPVYDSRDNCNAIIDTKSRTLILGCKNTIIPSSVGIIGQCAFWGCLGMTSINIPEGVVILYSYAFRECSDLESVTIPQSANLIYSDAFQNCSSLSSINVASGNEMYDSRDNCNAIIHTASNKLEVGCKNTIIPNSVTAIEIYAFAGCSGLTSIVIPNSVQSIGGSAFQNCSGLTSISIPNSVKTIGQDAFLGCSNLTSVTIPNSINTISFGTFWGSGLSSVIIPNSVKTIEGGAFYQCSSLETVIIPSSVTSIEDDAFGFSDHIKDVYCNSFKIPSMSYSAFNGSNPENITLHVPAGCVDKYMAIEPWNSFGNIVGDDIDSNLFPDCTDEEIRSAAIYLYYMGIVEGEDGKLYADREATRAEVAKTSFYGAYFGPSNVPAYMAVDDYPSVYTDLQDKSTYYYRPAKALLYLEYGDGVAPFGRNRLAFEPEGKIARVNVLKELLETFNIKPDVEGTDNPFPSDANVVTIANSNPVKMGYIRKAASLGIITTANNEFRPYANCTRGEEFLMLARIMQKIESGEITDPMPQESDYFEPLNTTLKTISLGTSLQMGNFQHYTKTSFALNGTVPLSFMHTYNSYNTTLSSVFYGDKSKTEEDDSYQPLGDGWSHNYHSFITVVGEYSSGTPDNGLRAIVHWGGGSIHVYKSDGSRLIPESMGVYDEFELDGQDAVIKSKSQMEYRFSKQGGTGSAVFYLYSVKDRNDNELTINYEDGQNGNKRISSVSDGHRSLRFSYLSGTDLLSEVKDPLNRSVKFDYFANKQTGKHQLKSFTDAEGNTTTYEYADLTKAGASKLLSRIQLPKGNYIENEYDANCRLKNTSNGLNGVPTTKTSVTVAANYGSGSISTESQVNVERGLQTATYNYTYNQNNVVSGMTGSQGLFVDNSYGSAEHPELPTAMESNRKDISNISYDAKGNVTKVTVSGDGTLTTTMTYDGMNNLTSVTDPKGNKITYNYDSNGNLIGISAPEGVTASITVDSKGLPTETSNPMGVKTQYQYNEYGNVTKATLPALGISSMAVYDAASRLTSATDALGRTRSFVYNDNDFLTRETDPMNHSTSYEYDKNDNLTNITNANGGVTTMSYDNATDWLHSVEFAGAIKQYGYNNDGTLSSFTKPDGTILNYNYDELGRITYDGVNSYSYDSKMRLSEISNGSKSVRFTYDGFNRIISTYNGNNINHYSYDDNGNCTGINGTQYRYDGLNRLTEVSFQGRNITYTYRKDSKLSEVTYPNGMTTTFGYDEVGRLTSKQTKLSDGTVIAGYTYVLDKVGNIIEQTTQEPYSEMVLTSEDITYSYNDGNRITKADDISFEFDANGNTTKRGSESYSWDKQDLLTTAGSTSITYDPQGLISSYGDIVFTTDPLGIGNVLSDSKSGAEYIYGNGLEARVANGTFSYYVTDMRGSVVAIVEEGGTITHQYQYNAFGKVVQKKEADYNPFQYVGKYGVMYLNDHLYYMRARHYDPNIGRFLSEDPVWSTNLYPYADNNPIMGIDPQGKAWIKVRALDLEDEPKVMPFLADASISSLSRPILDFFNIQAVHEQIFFDNPVTIEGINGGRPIYDIGFGADSDPTMVNDGNYYASWYIDTGEYIPDELVLEAVKSYKPTDNGEYNNLTNNCQTYVDKIRIIVKTLERRNKMIEETRGVKVW